MPRETIAPSELRLNAINQWEEKWFLLSCGDFQKNTFNCMTISWGSMGVIWSKPFVQVVVRPTRYTYLFMEKYQDFTISSFGPKYKRTLNILGSKSGRVMDKINKSGLTATQSTKVASPGFAEADLIIECRIMAKFPIKPEFFIDPAIESSYPTKDYHTSYFGEILHIEGVRELYT